MAVSGWIIKEWFYDPCFIGVYPWLMKDEEIQKRLSEVMLIGVLISAAVIALGVVWFLAFHAGTRAGDHLFTGEPKYFENPASMVRRALDFGVFGERRSLIMIGIVLLLINPVVRVAFAALGFAWQKDRLFAAISLFVLAVLLFSFFW